MVTGMHCRRSDPTDSSIVHASLISDESDMIGSRYPRYHLPSLIEHAPVSVTCESERSEPIGFASFDHLPTLASRLPVGGPRDWVYWMKEHFGEDSIFEATVASAARTEEKRGNHGMHRSGATEAAASAAAQGEQLSQNGAGSSVPSSTRHALGLGPSNELSDWDASARDEERRKRIKRMTERGSVWLNFFVADHLWERDVAEAIFRSLFVTLPECDRCFFALPEDTPMFAPLKELMVEVQPTDLGGDRLPYRIFVRSRECDIPTLTVRHAKVEDSDDLVPVFNAQSEVLSERYGEFFLASLIENQNEHHRTLVGEAMGTAVGLMSISDVVELDVLQRCFDLEPYDDLIKPAPHVDEPEGSVASGSLNDLRSLGRGGNTRSSLSIADGVQNEGNEDDQGTSASNNNEENDAEKAADAGAANDNADRNGKDDDVFGGDDEYADLEAARKEREAKLAAEKAAEELRQARIAAGLPPESESEGEDEESEAESLGDEDEPSSDEEDYLAEPERPNNVTVLRDMKRKQAEAAAADGSRSAGGSLVPASIGYDVGEEDINYVPNAFAVTLFCLSDVLESRSRDLLAKAFDEYPHLDYCVLTVPHTASEFPLLRLFSRVPSLPRETFHECLYVIHRDSLADASVVASIPPALGAATAAGTDGDAGNASNAGNAGAAVERLTVTPAAPVDRTGLAVLTSGLDNREDIMLAVMRHNKWAKEKARRERIIEEDDRRRERPGTSLSDPNGMSPISGGTAAGVLLSDEDRAELLRGPTETVFVMRCDGVPVAVAVIETSVDLAKLRLHYDLDDFFEIDGLHDDVTESGAAAEDGNADSGTGAPSGSGMGSGGGGGSGSADSDESGLAGISDPRELHDARAQGGSGHAARLHARLVHLVVNPIFTGQTPHFLRRCLLRLGKTTIHHFDYPDTPCPRAVLRHFVQVRPRRQVIHRKGPCCTKGAHGWTKERPFALSVLSLRLMTEPRTTVNTRIVVVGASTCSLSFLESILYVPYLDFAAVTLVSEGGLPSGFDEEMANGLILENGAITSMSNVNKAREPVDEGLTARFMPTDHAYSRRLLVQLGLEDRLREVEASVIDIDRDNRCVTLRGWDTEFGGAGNNGGNMNNGGMYGGGYGDSHGGAHFDNDLDDSLEGEKGQFASLPYDVLIVCAGLQDQTIPRGGWSAVNGIFTLSNEEECERLLEFLDDDFTRSSTQVVVYGSTLGAYTAIQGLIDSGVRPSRIRMIHPPSSDDFSCFNDPHIDQTMSATLDNLGVKQTHDIVLSGIRSDEGGNLVAAEFNKSSAHADDNASHQQHQQQLVRYECELLISCNRGDVGVDIFKALNHNSIVYDGRLVVDSNFRTNDPNIYAAGTMVKFSRRYHQKLPMELYRTKEVGRTLANTLLPMLDPDGGGIPDAISPDGTVIQPPIFDDPVITGGYVPGPCYFYKTEVPKRAASHAISSAVAAAYGRDLVTLSEPRASRGNVNASACYVRVHVDPSDKVEAVVYYGGEPAEFSNLGCLVGLPETYLSRLVARYDEGLIDDIAEFMRGNWAAALFHDRFQEFRSQLKAKTRSLAEMQEIERLVRGWVEVNPRLDAQQKLDLRTKLSNTVNTVAQQAVVDYLLGNRGHLHMYFVPTMGFSNQG